MNQMLYLIVERELMSEGPKRFAPGQIRWVGVDVRVAVYGIFCDGCICYRN